jgi:hypothetical protein
MNVRILVLPPQSGPSQIHPKLTFDQIAERHVPTHSGGCVWLHPGLQRARKAWIICLPMRDDIVLGHAPLQHL